MKRLFVSDLDDTLVENGKILPEYTIEELNRIFNDDEKEFVISSARNYANITRRIKGLKKNIKLIARNGSIIYDENGNVIKKYYISEKDVLKAIRYSLDNFLCPIVIEINNNEEIYILDNKYINDEVIFSQKDLNIRYSEDLEKESFKNVIGVYSFGKVEQEKNYELDGIKVIKYKNFIHFIGKNVDKGYALKELNKIYKYENITCFGDSESDYPMLNYSDNPYYISKEYDNKNNKYNNLIFDNGISILKIMEK